MYSSKDMISESSFIDCPSALSLYFIGQSKTDVLSSRGIGIDVISASSGRFGNPRTGAGVYTSDNNYSHPLLIASSNEDLYVVQNAAFILASVGSGEFKLVSIDPNYESGIEILPSMLSGITSIAVDAFKHTRTI